MRRRVCAEPWRSLGDVEKRKQEDPDDVDEMPVDTDVLDAMELLVARGGQRHDEHDYHAGNDVCGMQAGRRVVEGPEQARGDGEALRDFMSPLESLDHQEDAAAANHVV